MPGPYDIGDRVTLDVTFTNAGGTATSPTTVTLQVTPPGGTATTVSNSAGATGVYTATYDPTVAGIHYYRWAGTGALVVAEEGQFHVRPRRVL